MLNCLKKYKKQFIALLLCGIILVSAPDFKIDTYAFVDPVTVTLEVVVGIVLVTMGIVATSSTNQELAHDVSLWISTKYSDFVDEYMSDPSFLGSILPNPFDESALARAGASVLIGSVTYVKLVNYIKEYFKEKYPQAFEGDTSTGSTTITSGITSSIGSDTVLYTLRQTVASCCYSYLVNPYTASNYTSTESWYDYLLSKKYATYNTMLSDTLPSDWHYVDVYVKSYAKLKSDGSASTYYFNVYFVFNNGDYDDNYSLCGYRFSCTSDSESGIGGSGFSVYGVKSFADFGDIYSLSLYSYYDSDGLYYNSSTLADYGQPTIRYINTDYAVDSDDTFIGPVQGALTLPFELADDNAFTDDEYAEKIVEKYGTTDAVYDVNGDAVDFDDTVIPVHVPSYADTYNPISDFFDDLSKRDVLDGSIKTGVQEGVREKSAAETDVSDGTALGGINSIINYIKNIPSLLRNILSAITDLPSAIITGLSKLFLPDTDFVESSVDEIKTSFNNKFSPPNWSVSAAFGQEQAMEDKEVTQNMGNYTFTYKLIDWSYAKKAIDDFRSYIRGFLALLLVLYSINQFLGLIGQPTLSTLGSSAPEGGTDKSRGNDWNYWKGW